MKAFKQTKLICYMFSSYSIYSRHSSQEEYGNLVLIPFKSLRGKLFFLCEMRCLLTELKHSHLLVFASLAVRPVVAVNFFVILTDFQIIC